MREYLRLLTYLKPCMHMVALIVGSSFVLLALQCLSVWVGAGFIEQIIAQKPIDFAGQNDFFLVGWLNAVARKILLKPDPFDSLLAGTFLLISTRVLILVVNSIKLYLLCVTNQLVLSRLRCRLFERLTQAEISFTQKVRPGEIASIFARDVDQLNGAITDAVDRMVLHPLQLLFALALMASISFPACVFIVTLLLSAGMVMHLVGGYIQQLSRRGMEIVSHMQGHLVEYCSNVIVARIFNRESQEYSSFEQTSDSIGKMTTKLVFVRNLAPELSEIMLVIGGGALLLALGHRVLVLQSMSVSDMLRIALLLPLASSSMGTLAKLYASIRQSMASARRVFSIMDLEIARPDPPDAVSPKIFSDSIQFIRVDYTVGDRAILKDISFCIPRGARVVIYGPSGAGKSTILGLLAGYLDCSSGNITIDGIDMFHLKRSMWREQLAMVPQMPFLLNGTVEDNLRYVKPDGTREQFQKALECALLGSDQLANGLVTPVGNSGNLLSGGERQRLTIARALLNEPSVLLMDEPTSMLDDENRTKIKESIVSASSNRTLVLVTHDPILREIADIELELQEGRLVS